MAATDVQNAALVWTKRADRGSPRARPWVIVALVALGVVAGVALWRSFDDTSQRPVQQTQSSGAPGDARTAIRNGANTLTGGDEIEAALGWLASLELRNVAVCRSSDIDLHPSNVLGGMRVVGRRCSGSISRAAAHDIASSDPQAVIFDGTTHDAIVFIEALRAEGSFAMVVITSSADAREVTRVIRSSARTWLAATEVTEASSRGTRAVRVGMLTARGAIGR